MVRHDVCVGIRETCSVAMASIAAYLVDGLYILLLSSLTIGLAAHMAAELIVECLDEQAVVLQVPEMPEGQATSRQKLQQLVQNHDSTVQQALGSDRQCLGCIIECIDCHIRKQATGPCRRSCSLHDQKAILRRACKHQSMHAHAAAERCNANENSPVHKPLTTQ